LPSDERTAFISYSREDSEFALRMAKDLKAAGANVWLDQLDIQPGQRWARALQEAISNAPRFLVILSPASVNSTNVEDEVAFALEEHKTIIPVLYRDCKVPFQLRPFQYADFRSDYERGLQILLQTLGVKLPPESIPPPPPPKPKDAPPKVSDAAESLRKAEQARKEQQARKAAQQSRLEQEERKRVAAESSRIEQQAREQAQKEEEARKAGEQSRLEQEERKRAVAESSRVAQQVHEKQGQAPSHVPISRHPWTRIAIGLGIVMIALVLYWATRPGKQAEEPQKQQATIDSPKPAVIPPSTDTQVKSESPAPSAQPPSSEPKSAPLTTETKPASPIDAAPNDAARQALLGEHRLSLQWISWQKFGQAVVTDNGGVLTLKGSQEIEGEYVTLDGIITSIQPKSFVFHGTIVTKARIVNKGQPCTRQGDMTFLITGARRYWRLQQMDNPCDPVTDYVDIYFR
jgi:hypothetical protein